MAIYGHFPFTRLAAPPQDFFPPFCIQKSSPQLLKKQNPKPKNFSSARADSTTSGINSVGVFYSSKKRGGVKDASHFFRKRKKLILDAPPFFALNSPPTELFQQVMSRYTPNAIISNLHPSEAYTKKLPKSKKRKSGVLRNSPLFVRRTVPPLPGRKTKIFFFSTLFTLLSPQDNNSPAHFSIDKPLG